MKRREFVAASCLAGMAPLSALAQGAGSGVPGSKELYELRVYRLEPGPKEKQFDDFARQAAIPALNRIGIAPVGVFRMAEGAEGESAERFVLLPHTSAESVLTMTQKLGEEAEFLEAGAEFLDAPKNDPAYQRFESSLLLAFDGHPKLAVPSKKDSRLFQLRIYESHNTERAQKKIEMFNAGEIEIFHRTGLNPVFFGEALVGSKLPNLTYMVGFDDEAAMEEAWKKFRADPGWLEMRGDPQYKDTVSNITNLLLRPAGGSQI
jgi:hypothetical protein